MNAIPSGMKAKDAQRFLRQQNACFGDDFMPMPEDKWPKVTDEKSKRIGLFRSKHFLVQVFEERDGIMRLSINRTMVNGHGEYLEGITWDELQKIKAGVGLGAFDALEIFPAEGSVVNVANIRHLWVMPNPVPFKW